MVTSMLTSYNLSSSFWSEALLTLIMCVIEYDIKETPYELWQKLSA